MAFKPNRSITSVNLLASERSPVSNLRTRQLLDRRKAAFAKSHQGQLKEITPGEDPLTKNAAEILQIVFSSTQKSPAPLCYSLKFVELWFAGSESRDSLSAFKDPTAPAISWLVPLTKSASERIPEHPQSTHQTTRDRLSSDFNDPKYGPGIDSLADQTTPRIRMEQSFDLNSVERLIIHFGALDGLDTMAPETSLHQNFGANATPGSSHLGSAMPLTTRPPGFIHSPISPAISRTIDQELMCSGERIASGYAARQSLGWPDYAANHLPSQLPNEVRPAKFLAHATTLSAQSRAKIGRQVRPQQP